MSSFGLIKYWDEDASLAVLFGIFIVFGFWRFKVLLSKVKNFSKKY